MELTPQQQEQIKQLIEQNRQYKTDIKELIEVVRNIVLVLGLLDEQTGMIKAEYLSGEENPIKAILKSISGLVTDMMIRPKKVEEKFAFVQTILPILERYATKQ